MTKDPRGGPRAGSGRKKDPNAKQAYGTRLSQDTIAFLRSLKNAADFIDSNVQQTEAFQLWKAKPKRKPANRPRKGE